MNEVLLARHRNLWSIWGFTLTLTKLIIAILLHFMLKYAMEHGYASPNACEATSYNWLQFLWYLNSTAILSGRTWLLIVEPQFELCKIHVLQGNVLQISGPVSELLNIW
jgi:hypothetical protein